MMKKVFVGTDVCIDLLSGRKSFTFPAEKIFSQAHKKEIKIVISSLTFANMDFILNTRFKVKTTRNLLLQFKTLVSVAAVDEKIIELALTSEFPDFEDAIQYYTAMENKVSLIITRNIKDYSKSLIPVATPESYLA